MTCSTLGIDLSTEPERTAACLLHWARGRATVTKLLPDGDSRSLDDAGIVDLITNTSRLAKVGIDSPFGWPDDFRAATKAYAESLAWPLEPSPEEVRRRLRYRETDRFVAKTYRPLSVVAERLGATAMRAATLLTMLKAEGVKPDRTGRKGPVVEVYPAAALVAWGFEPQRRGGENAHERRRRLVNVFARRTTRWLELDSALRRRMREEEHLFDALISALVARAAERNLTEGLPRRLAAAAKREGWIALPLQGSLKRLATAPPAR